MEKGPNNGGFIHSSLKPVMSYNIVSHYKCLTSWGWLFIIRALRMEKMTSLWIFRMWREALQLVGTPSLSYRLAKHNKKSKTSCIPKEVKG